MDPSSDESDSNEPVNKKIKKSFKKNKYTVRIVSSEFLK